MEGVALLNISDYYVWYVYVFLFAKFTFVLPNLYRSGFILLVVVSNFNFLSHLYIFSRLRIFSTFSHFFFGGCMWLWRHQWRDAQQCAPYIVFNGRTLNYTQLYSTILKQPASMHDWLTLVTGHWSLIIKECKFEFWESPFIEIFRDLTCGFKYISETCLSQVIGFLRSKLTSSYHRTNAPLILRPEGPTVFCRVPEPPVRWR